MEALYQYLAQTLTFLDSLRWYHYLGLLVLYALIFGKKQLVDFEAKLFSEGSNEICGQLTIEQFEKSPLCAKLKLDKMRTLHGKTVAIYIAQQLVSQFQLDETGTAAEISYPVLTTGNTRRFRNSSARRWNEVRLPLNDDLRIENNLAVAIKVADKVFVEGLLLKD